MYVRTSLFTLAVIPLVVHFLSRCTLVLCSQGLSATEVIKAARDAEINIRKSSAQTLTIAFDETATEADLIALLKAFNLPATEARMFLPSLARTLCVFTFFLLYLCVLSLALLLTLFVPSRSPSISLSF
jgi:hypothetical protein